MNIWIGGRKNLSDNLILINTSSIIVIGIIKDIFIEVRVLLKVEIIAFI